MLAPRPTPVPLVPLVALLVAAAASGPAAAQAGRASCGCPGGGGQAAATLPLCPEGVVAPPPGWYSGDTHGHIQLCAGPPDLTPAELLAQTKASHLDVVSALLWGHTGLDPAQFGAYVATHLTGVEAPVSLGEPEVIQFGIEVSNLTADDLGHLIGLGIGPAQGDLAGLGLGCPPLWPAPGWKSDGSGDFSGPIFALWQQEPAAVNGYAHQAWPVAMFASAAAGGWDWESTSLPAWVGADARCVQGQDLALPAPGSCSNTTPSLAPFDAALRRLHFLEAHDLDHEVCDNDFHERRWYGLWYRLLSTGMRVSASGGQDADCVVGICKPRTWVRLADGEALTYDAWTRGLREGRVSLAVGAHRFLELEVEGQGPGAELVVPGAPTPKLRVTVRHHSALAGASSERDVVEVVRDGEVVASRPFTPQPGVATFAFDVPVAESGWLAARLRSQRAHTGAVSVYVDGRPIADCEAADYLALYADYLSWTLDVAAAAGPAAVEAFVGCSEAEVRDYVERGRRVYAAIRDYAAPPPTGVSRFGRPSPAACTPPPGIVASELPVAAQPYAIRGFHAPSDALGALVLGVAPDAAGLPLDGALLHVQLLPSTVLLGAIADEGGWSETALVLPPLAGATLYAQQVWLNPPGCQEDGAFSSTEGLALVLQP